MSPTHTAPWIEPTSHNKNIFVGIRLILAILVIFSHSYPILYGDNRFEPLFSLTNGLYSLGSVAVNLFLAISGFLVAGSWDRSKTTWNYLWKRIMRIYPAFITVMLLEAFILAPCATTESFTRYSISQLGILLFNIINLVEYGYPYGGLLSTFSSNPLPNVLNGSLWTIRFEFMCYFFLAIAGPVFFHRRWVAIAFMTGAAIWSGIGLLPPWHWILTGLFGYVYHWPALLSFFLAGMSAYRFRRAIPHSLLLAIASLALIGIAGAISPGLLRGVAPVCGTYLLLWVAYHPWLNARLWWKTGDFSYGTYLYGFPIQQSIVYWLSPYFALSVWSLAILGTGLAVLAGALSWVIVERPCLRLKRV